MRVFRNMIIGFIVGAVVFPFVVAGFAWGITAITEAVGDWGVVALFCGVIGAVAGLAASRQ